MTAVATESRPREVLLRVRLGLPVLQLLLLAVALAVVRWLWSYDSGVDEPLPWSFWAPVAGLLAALTLSAWAGWGLLRLTWHSTSRWPNVVAVLAEAATCSLLVPMLGVAPLAFVVELLYVPI